MPLPGSDRNPVFLQEIKEPVHETVIDEVNVPVHEETTNEDLASLTAQAESMGIAVKSHWNESQLKMAIRVRSANK